ncbi:MAG: hypothetical protein ABSG96_01985 [Terracidiphilus sp.]
MSPRGWGYLSIQPGAAAYQRMPGEIPLALLAGHFMGSLLYELKPDDKLSLAAALVGIVGVSLAASFNPARRASSIDPARALRSE